jgi:hypothetical protein
MGNQLLLALPPLLRIPTELHLEITSHLDDQKSKDDGFSLLRLRLTNRLFYTLIPASTHAMLLRLESSRFAKVRKLFACRFCVRLRCRRDFVHEVVIRYSTLQNRPHPLRKRRFCTAPVSLGYPLLVSANPRLLKLTSSNQASL